MNKLGPALALFALSSVAAGCASPTGNEPIEAPSLAIAWTAEPGEHVVRCTRLTTEESLQVNAIDALASPGTRRITVWSGPDADTEACPEVQVSGLLYDGLDSLELPTGLALHVPAGSGLWLRVEIVNDGAGPLQGTSGVALSTTDQARELADVVALSADLAEGTRCTMSADAFVFAIAPTVATAAHMDLTAQSSFAGGDVVLFAGGDTAGTRSLAKPVALVAGEELELSCVSGDGLSSTASAPGPHEACQVAVYRFPAAPIGCL